MTNLNFDSDVSNTDLVIITSFILKKDFSKLMLLHSCPYNYGQGGIKVPRLSDLTSTFESLPSYAEEKENIIEENFSYCYFYV